MFNITQIRCSQGTVSAAALFAGAALMVSLSACVTSEEPQPPHLADNFGDAVRQNIAAQVINPEAAGPDESDRIDGQSAERALESRRTRAIEPESQSLIISAGGGN